MDTNTFNTIEIKTNILADNDKSAEETRRLLNKTSTFFVNLMSSPGGGKTTTLVRTVKALKDKYKIGVIEADVDSDVDARSVIEAGAKAVQLHTGGACHMDADMTRQGLDELKLDELDIVFLENVGNLVCPAEFDVGADKKVCILSVPEGDDKPLKYPLMFTVSDLLLINKIDAKAVFDFDKDTCLGYCKKLNPSIECIEISSLTGENFDEWISWLIKHVEEKKAR